MTVKPSPCHPHRRPPGVVCALVREPLATFELAICTEIFGLPRPELSDPWYRFRVVDAEDPDGRRAIEANGGIGVVAGHGLAALEDAELIVVPGWPVSADPVPGVAEALRRASDRGARVASICSGVFALVEAGLLDGRRATTHWAYLDALRQRAPRTEIVEDVLYVDEGAVLTSAGSAAGLDLCLHIVHRDLGADAANAVARRLVVPAHRDGGQAQFVPRPVPSRAERRIGPLLDLLRGRLDEVWTVDRIAELAGASPRTLLRRFHDATGLAPGAWLVRERVQAARDLLERTAYPIETIAETVGFGSAETFRHHFRRLTTVSPRRYRAQFRDDRSVV